LGIAGPAVRDAVAAETDLHVSLHYEIDHSVRRCWDEAEFRRSVARRVGYDPFRDSAPVRVSIHVAGSASAVDGQVDWRNASGASMGEREFVARNGNCLQLLTEMSFAVSLQIELLRPKAPASTTPAPSATGAAASSASASTPATVAAKPASTPAPATPAPPGPTPPPTAPEPPAAASDKPPRSSDDAALEARPADGPASPRWPMWLGIGPSLAWGIAPSITADARLFFGVRRRDLSLEVGAEASLPSTDRRSDGSGFRQSLIGASAAVCGHRRAFSACVLGKASQIRVSGLGVDQPRSPTDFVAQAGLRLAAALELGGPWFATAHLDALGLITPMTVDLNHSGVWEMSRLGALAGIDVSARFR
jgi:hypothetical protein